VTSRAPLAKLSARVQTVSLATIKPMESLGGYGKGRGGRPWRRLVEAVKVRDACKCQQCGRVTLEGACDHIVPCSQGGSDDMSNLQWLCDGPGSCHEAKSKREAAEARNPGL